MLSVGDEPNAIVALHILTATVDSDIAAPLQNAMPLR